MTRILITNDDGFRAEGLHALAAQLAATGADVTVAAPMHEASGSSAAISAIATGGHVTIESWPVPGTANVAGYAVNSTPALIALIATHGAFGASPTIVMSGINRGANTGRAIIHSGTVGAALTAAGAGCHAMAISLDVGTSNQPTPPAYHWPTAAGIAEILLPRLIELPVGAVINVNVPDLPMEQIRGIRNAHLGGFGRVQITETEPTTGIIRISLEDPEDDTPGSDQMLLADGYATVTAVNPISEATHTLAISDLADGYASVSHLR